MNAPVPSGEVQASRGGASPPRFSVVMPSYNRADTLPRAIASVLAQRCQDWELLVVDDGSTDATSQVLATFQDPRLRLFQQANQGVAVARNVALRAARGSLIAFLDSDDEWPPHHLALMDAFFAAHPDEDLATSEWWQDYGGQRYVKHFQVEMRAWYPELGRRVRAPLFVGADPPDPLLRFFDAGSPVGEWAGAALAGTPHAGAWHYRGRIGPLWRFGWLTALQPTVVTRRALEALGPFDETYRIASDYPWLVGACRRYVTNLLTVPGCFKHELSAEGRPVAEGHLVSGRTATQFHEEVLRGMEELFWATRPDDPELAALRGYRQVWVAQAALHQGRLARARTLLAEARRTYPGPDTEALYWLARLAPGERSGARLFDAASWLAQLPARLARLARRLAGPVARPGQARHAGRQGSRPA